jgi:hypothetical protein
MMVSVPHALAMALLAYYAVDRRVFSDAPVVVSLVTLPPLGAPPEIVRQNRVRYADDPRVPLVATGPYVENVGAHILAMRPPLSVARPLSLSKQTLALGVSRLPLAINGETCMPLPQSRTVPVDMCARMLGLEKASAYYPPEDLYVCDARPVP